MAKSEAGDGREQAFRILLRVETSGAFASILLDRLPEKALDPRDLRLATELVFGTLRWQARLDHCLQQISSRPLNELHPAVRVGLRLACHQILNLDRIPDPAAVNGSVLLVRRAAGEPGARFTNGVLRSLCRRAGEISFPPPDSPDPADWPAIHSHPSWMIERWIGRWGKAETRALLEADNRPAPLALRLQKPAAGTDQLAARLKSEGVETVHSAVLPSVLRVVRGNPFRTRAFSEGWFYAQDEASQIVPQLLGEPIAGPVLDMCAAPGGKAIRIASGGADPPLVIAADRHLRRLERLRENRDRLGLANLLPLGADFSRGSPLSARFPAVILDAPCSGTGTLRRHPEIRWRLKPGDLRRLGVIQKDLLDTAARHVAAGGVLVYSVCSLEEEEGRCRVEAFLGQHADFRLGDARKFLPESIHSCATDGPFLATFPHREGMDGFFAARLERRPG